MVFRNAGRFRGGVQRDATGDGPAVQEQRCLAEARRHRLAG